jgi:hypothetical protein
MLSLDMVLSNIIYKIFLLVLALLSSAFLVWHFILDDAERQMVNSLCFKSLASLGFFKNQVEK